MIPVKRFPEPEVLAKHKDRWTEEFLEERKKDANVKVRPSSKRYAHEEVKETLQSMSHCKCFYCEGSTKDEKAEVDHHVEVAEDPALAFVWENLYLSCQGCNKAKNRARHIPASACLDPCAEGVEPWEHLTFEDELIRANNGSQTGLNTIQKYGLNRDELDLRRSRRLRLLSKEVNKIKDAMIRDGRNAMRAEEIALLKSFVQPDSPFSLACRGPIAEELSKTPNSQ